MLILHTSDWHIGRTLHRASLARAFELWCDHVVDLVRERGIDAVLISGDVYDRSIPPTESVTLFDRTLERLADLTTVILTSGNHDSPQRLGFASSLMKPSIHVRTRSVDCAKPVEVRGKDGELALVYPIPYLDPDVERVVLGDEDEPLERSHEAVVGAALKLVKEDIEHGPHAGEAIARIVMAHLFVTGAEPNSSERNISIGGVDSVPSGIFRLGEERGGPLSYVALGHLHSPQQVGTEDDPLMRYSGSPVALSFSETRAKSSVLLHIKGSEVQPELIPAPVWRAVRTFEGTMEELASLASEANECFSRVIVTEDARPADMAATIYSMFPNVLELQHRPSRSVEANEAPIHAMDPFEVLEVFMREAGNREVTDEERTILRSVWESVRQEER